MTMNVPGSAIGQLHAERRLAQHGQAALDLAYLRRALQTAEENVHADGGPFGAVVVSPDGRAFAAGNRVTADTDPTAHAEVSAIRLAAKELGTFDLTGCTLYSSCEPCPMCFTACQWSRLDRVLFAATQDDAALAGFDDSAFYRMIRLEQDAATPVTLFRGDLDPTAPFRAWAALEDRIDY